MYHYYYYYYPRTNKLVQQSPTCEIVMVPRRSSSHPATPPLTHSATSSPISSPATPTVEMARRPRVQFENTVRSRRAPYDAELNVMRAFARHASHCRRCSSPYQTWKRGEELCKRGLDYAGDVAKYISSHDGIPYSVIDKNISDNRDKVEIEVPANCLVIRDLVKAFDGGLLRGQSRRPIVSHDFDHYVPSRHSAVHLYDDEMGHGIEIKPASSCMSRRQERVRYSLDGSGVGAAAGGRGECSRPTIVGDRRGSLYYKDEEAKQSQTRWNVDPIIIVAEPKSRRRGSRVYIW